MKRPYFGLLSLLLLAVASVRVYAQDPPPPPPPPPCCQKSPQIVAGETGDRSLSTVQMSVSVAEEILSRSGISRSQFLERLASSLFPEKETELVYTSSRLLSAEASNNKRSSGEGAEERLVGIQEKRIYQVALARMNPDELQLLDLVYLTDGTFYAKVSFTRTNSLISE